MLNEKRFNYLVFTGAANSIDFYSSSSSSLSSAYFSESEFKFEFFNFNFSSLAKI